ncbi:hypothetical protein J2I47_05525 [Fibrella sp. HMF5335]|uniref:Outer membrane protein beta-barrel domain-containing protein n=1 Tax=Fibrella rubiginis TaxID=2817060 RepID=A0A939GFT9_9BACT|nr:hypothetical protein [Fibrella rubiginis]MBO0936000.1 hypothetical protein [Fibrella rubiginis]
MLHNFRSYRIALVLVTLLTTAQAQNSPPTADPVPDYAEFNRRAVVPVEFGMGFSSQQSKSLFSVQTCPQFTPINHYLRVGAVIGAAYTAGSPELKTEHWVAYAGPRIALKLTSLDVKINGLPEGILWGNMQLFVEHLWGQTNAKLLGGGVALEILKRYGVALKIHRDYEHQSTWGQFAVAYNVIGQRKEKSFQDN